MASPINTTVSVPLVEEDEVPEEEIVYAENMDPEIMPDVELK
jgi:hypothetical protein